MLTRLKSEDEQWSEEVKTLGTEDAQPTEEQKTRGIGYIDVTSLA